MKAGGRTAYFAGGGDRDQTASLDARKAARELVKTHPEVGFNILFSAASFVIRDGRAPKDAAVLEEARSRMAGLQATVERNRKRFAK